MSIYPVQLSEWFPLGDEMYSIAQIIAETSRCLACRKRVKYKKMVGHHSLPWGNGDVFCGWKCCKSGKRAKPDKRRERRYKRKYKDFEVEVNL